MRKRVVITGLGVVSPVGIGKEAFWQALTQGRSGIGKITSFDVSEYPSQIAGEVKDFVPENHIDSRRARRMSRFSQFAVAAARMAVEDSGLQMEANDLHRVGVCFGSSIGGGNVFEQEHCVFLAKGPMSIKPSSWSEYIVHATTSHICIELGIKGPTMTIASGCCTGLDVVNWGCSQIHAGEVEVTIVGSAESPLFPFSFSVLCSMGALSKRNNDPQKASRPYDLHRDGVVVSEGGAAIVLEELEHALDRNAKIYAEVLGFASADEGDHMLRCDTSGETLARAIEIALANAGLSKLGIDYINSHGNSLPDYDLCETNAFKRAFGEGAYNIPISSIKSMIGQALAAGGGFQVVSSCLTIENSLIPPTINYEVPDPQCDLDYVPNQARVARVKKVLTNAHSIGGMHSLLALGKLDL